MKYPELKENQVKIYNGLKTIGNEIVSFYVDGVRIINDQGFVTKAYLLAHIAREIDGGLRDLLSDDINNPKFENIESNHLKSILSSLDIDDTGDLFAKFWNSTARQFNKFAHRSGAYKDPRIPDQVISLWNDYEVILLKLIGEYINQIKLLERIIKKDPDEKVINLAKNFIREDSKQIHFYNNLKNVNWFLPLYKANFFDPAKIPNVSENKYWSPIAYLTLISEKIKEGTFNEDHSKELIVIIKNIATSVHYPNYSDDIRLWYFLFKILSNLPSKYLKSDFLEYYKNFFNSKYDLSLASMGIVELLKTYLNEVKLTEESVLIFEELLAFSFEVTKSNKGNENSESYNPRVENYLLKEISKDKLICERIAYLISDKTFFSIIDQFEIYLEADYVEGIFKNSIFFDEDRGYTEDSIEIIYTDFFKNIAFFLNQKDGNRLQKIISTLISDRYNHNFIIKLCYYFISLNWNTSKSEFFKLIKNKDERLCFSNRDNNNDLYFLLEKISLELNNDECEIILEIIQGGSKNEYFLQEDLERFKELWFSPLRENTFFKEYYNQLKNVNEKDYILYKPKKETFVTWGSQSPYTKTELSAFPSIKLASILQNFDPIRGFNTPDADGLSTVLEELISKNPEKFTADYSDFLKVPFLYSTKIIYGLNKALDSKIEIDWESTLYFILDYISSNSFKNDELKLTHNHFSYNNYSFISAACRLISRGNKKPEDNYDKAFVILTEQIFETFLKYISVNPNDENNEKIGSMMELINSNNGIIIESYTLFLLRKARDLNSDVNVKLKRWKKSEESIFNNLFKSGCRELFMLFGYFKPQLIFIDHEWFMNIIKSVPLQNSNLIKAFFGTHILADDPTYLDYKFFKDIYQKAIIENWEIDNSGMSNSIARHVGVFYLFGYDNLESGGLMDTFLNAKQVDKIGKLVHFFSHYVKGYVDSLENQNDRIIIKNRIIELWKNIYLILNEINSESSKVEISGLINFLQFVDQLDENNIQLIINTSEINSRYWEVNKLLENLNRLKSNGNEIKIGFYIIDIIKSCVFHDTYFLSTYGDKYFGIFEHLYNLNNVEITNQVNTICNQLAQKNIHKFNELYEKYNKGSF